MLQHAGDTVICETGTIVTQLQAQLFLWVDNNSQRVVGMRPVFAVDEFEIIHVIAKVALHRRILINEQAVKQRSTRCNIAPVLDVY